MIALWGWVGNGKSRVAMGNNGLSPQLMSQHAVRTAGWAISAA